MNADEPRECIPTRELLHNGGFEAGSVAGFEPFVGTGRVVERVGSAETCTGQGASSSARRGRYAFSTSSRDGARADGHEVVLTQVLDVRELGLTPGTYLAASAFVSGGCGVGGDGVAQLVVDFTRGGPDGEYLGQLATGNVDPTEGTWQQMITRPRALPEGADTIVLAYRAASSNEPRGVELWTDDLSLAVCGQGREIDAWQEADPEADAEIAASPSEASTLPLQGNPSDRTAGEDSPPVPDEAALGPTTPTYDAQPGEPEQRPAPVLSVTAERPGCLSETPAGVILLDESCRYELSESTPDGDYQFEYVAQLWTGEYGIWLAGTEQGASLVNPRITLSAMAGVALNSEGRAVPTKKERFFEMPVSARMRLVRSGDRLLFYMNEELMFAQPVARVEGRLGFWSRGGKPTIRVLSMRPLRLEEIAAYADAPNIPGPDTMSTDPVEAQEAKEASATFAWSYRLNFNLGDNHGASFKQNREWHENGIDLFQPGLEVARFRRFAGPFYFVYGGAAAYVTAKSSLCDGELVCSEPEKCECLSNGASWGTRGFSYGPMAALALGALGTDGTGALLWLPILRVNHVVSTTVSQECEAPGDCPDSKWALDGVQLEVSAGADFIYNHGGGCGPRINFSYFLGDIAARQRLGLVLTWGLNFHIEQMGL